MMLQFRDVIEKPLAEVTTQDAMRFWKLVNTSAYEEATKIDIRGAVKRFLKFQFRDAAMLEFLPVGEYRVNSKRLNKHVLFTEDEISRMLHRAERQRDKALLSVLYETAARPQEIRDLKWADVNWELQEVRLYCTKTKKDRSLPVRDALEELQRWHEAWVLPEPEPADAVFPASYGPKIDRRQGISVTYINRVVKRLARLAGISRDVTTYLLRHTRLTQLRNSKKNKVDGLHWKLFAGHSPSSKMEERYVHLDNDDMKRAVIACAYSEETSDESDRPNAEKRFAELENQNRILASHFAEVVALLRDSRVKPTTPRLELTS